MMCSKIFVLVVLCIAVQSKYVPRSLLKWEIDPTLQGKIRTSVKQLKLDQELLDDYSQIVTSTYWRNDKTDNIWVHSSLSDQTFSVRPPGNRGFIEINYPSGTESVAHYHTIDLLAFPNGGEIELDYWLVSKSGNDIELLVQLMKLTSHEAVILANLSSSYTDSYGSKWQTVKIAIPATEELVQLCIQGYRRRHVNTGLAIARILIRDGSGVVTSTQAPATTTTEAVVTTRERSTEAPSTTTLAVVTTPEGTTEAPTTTTSEQTTTTTEIVTETPTQLPETTTVEIGTTPYVPFEFVDDYSAIVNSTTWMNNKEENIWVHSSITEESGAVLRPPEGRGFIEINYPVSINTYAHYHTIENLQFPYGGSLQFDYWLRADTLSDAQIRVFTYLRKYHNITLATLTYEDNKPGVDWQTVNLEIPASTEPVQLCIQGHRRRIDSTGLAVAKISVKSNSN